jgi:hypothetical protein
MRSADLERAASFYAALGLSFAREHYSSGLEHLAAQKGSIVFEVYPKGSGNTTSV